MQREGRKERKEGKERGGKKKRTLAVLQQLACFRLTKGNYGFRRL